MAQIEALCTSQANAELQLCAAQFLTIAQSWDLCAPMALASQQVWIVFHYEEGARQD